MDSNDALAEIQKRISHRKFYSFVPYEWQEDFFAGGRSYLQRMLMAANRVGKTFCAAYEVTCHATGEYPEWWEGFRIENKAPFIWVSSLTNETSREIIQKELLGEVGNFGTGMIPKDSIIDVKYRQAGIPDVVDTIMVRHSSGKTCVIKTKAAEQGWQKYQGTQPDFIWQDEEPDHFKVITECFTRLMTSAGRFIVTFTPLLGDTELVQHFKEESDTRQIYTATWDDAAHLDEKTKEDYLAALPKHERDARSKGVPMMGEGAVFPISDDDIVCPPIPIPDHFRRICGVDFGTNHPAGGAWLAHDVDTDIVYLYDEYRKDRELPPYHASTIKRRDPSNIIPVSWPHDGVNEERSSGDQVAMQYGAEGVNMLPISARYDDDTGGRQPVEPIVMDLHQRMMDGRFKVFSTCHLFLEEKRGLHRKNSKIVALRDDVFKSVTYGMMMLRYATPMYFAANPKTQGLNKPIM